MPENTIATLANVAGGPGFSWSDEMSQVTPTAGDLKDAIELRPELAYSVAAEQSLKGMETRLQECTDALALKQQDWSTVAKMREDELAGLEKQYTDLEKTLKDFQWKKNKLRAELRETMAAEAAAAHTESDQLALANKYDLETQKQITEGKGLQEEYEMLVAKERDLAQAQREELYEIKGTLQDQVMAINDQAMRASQQWQEMKKDRAQIEAKHGYEKGNTEKEENMFKHKREQVTAQKREVDMAALSTKHRIQSDAKAFAEAHHVSRGRFLEARKGLIHG